MFNKPFRVKSNTQMKGSDRKKIRLELLKHFPQLTEDNVQTLFSNKDMIIAMKIVTNTDESVMVYCVQKIPIVFEFNQVFYPTVYMLWKVPNLLPTFTTWPLVFPKITGGADLMLPGVIVKEPVTISSYGKLKKGDRVAINLTNNKAPIAVGQAALASDDMYMAARRGKAVKVLHYVGDQLWSYGTKLAVPELGPPDGVTDLIGENTGEAGSPECPDPFIALTVNTEHQQQEIISNQGTDQRNTSTSSNTNNSCGSSVAESMVQMSISDLNADEEVLDPQAAMDHLLIYCFLKAWKSFVKKPEFPILASNFYKVQMIPSCPSGLSLDVKKSSYKKVSQFLDYMAKENVVVTRELNKGVVSIMSVNWEHCMMKEFVDVYAGTEEDVSGQEIKSSCTPKITEMFEITTAVLPVMSLFKLRKGAKILSSDVKKHLGEYIRSNNAQSTQSQSMVRLDQTLSLILQCSEVGLEMSRENLHEKFLERMKRCYQIEYPTKATSIQAKGKLEPIDIQVAKRTGNKKVTLIYNLELFGIDLQEFARECQHGVAASSSISTVSHRKGPQLLIQGNQVAFVGKLLQEKYEIPKKYIRGLDKAVKPKK